MRIEAYISGSGSLLWLFITLNQRRTLDMIGPWFNVCCIAALSTPVCHLLAPRAGC